jgi:alkaline phosphatase D
MRKTPPPTAPPETESPPSRRDVLRGAGALGITALTPGLLTGCGSDDAPAEARFIHGIASGDPLPDGVILWTRVTTTASGDIKGTWELATDPQMANIVLSGDFETSGARDHTVKVDVRGLSPATTYHYRFRVAAAVSPIGRTRTAPVGPVARARFGVASCSSYAQGYFHAYRALAARTDLDVILHLGDYVYESGPGQFGSDRAHEPAHEALTLADYRTRHAQYKRDPDLQAVHQQHPFIPIWDDHETANNAWSTGAENHQVAEGAWADRKAAGQRAYSEWMPIRDQADGTRIWRKLTWGDLADLIMLDTRLWGRTASSPALVGPAPQEEPGATVLGNDQEAWLTEQLMGSTAHWKLIGQQVMVANLILQPGMLANLDQWHGYPAARRRFLDSLAAMNRPNVVILTGDLHSSWANELAVDPLDPAQYDPATGRGAVAVEFVTPGITSPGLPPFLFPVVESARPFNPHLRWFDLAQQGYMILDVTPERTQAAWFLYASIKMPTATPEQFAGAWSVKSGSTRLEADPAAAT